MMRTTWILSGALLLGCGADEEAECVAGDPYDPAITASDFGATVDNQLWPLVPGTHFVFEGGGETVDVTVLAETKDVFGTTAVVVRDTVTIGGALVEDTVDWYAQDNDGNVWYLGEDTKEYEGGVVVSTEGSWEAGVNDALPGIVMHATQPVAGEPYRQEFLRCEAEDMAEVVSTNESVTVPFGTFDNCLQTREFTPLDPEVNEHKYYCPGIGLVLEVEIASGRRIELGSVGTP